MNISYHVKLEENIHTILYISGSKPRVREKSQWVREIQDLSRFEHYLFVKISQGIHKFLFLCLGVREHKKVGNRCSLSHLNFIVYNIDAWSFHGKDKIAEMTFYENFNL